MYTVYFGDYQFDMLDGMYNWQDEYLEVWLPSESTDLNTIDSILSNASNLQNIYIYDEFDKLIAKSEKKYTEYDYIKRIPKYQIDMYSPEGIREPQYVEAVEVRIRRPSADTKLTKIQATMEYMAIMSDIDIDEEI